MRSPKCLPLNVFVASVLLAISAAASAQTGRSEQTGQSEKPAQKNAGGEASVVLQSTITGNQEQPKVLYIVPWQGPGGADQLNTGLQPVLSDVFAPVDRREFQRELKYRQMTAE